MDGRTDGRMDRQIDRLFLMSSQMRRFIYQGETLQYNNLRMLLKKGKKEENKQKKKKKNRSNRKSSKPANVLIRLCPQDP